MILYFISILNFKNGDASASSVKPVLETISTPNDDISANVTVETTTHPAPPR